MRFHYVFQLNIHAHSPASPLSPNPPPTSDLYSYISLKLLLSINFILIHGISMYNVDIVTTVIIVFLFCSSFNDINFNCFIFLHYTNIYGGSSKQRYYERISKIILFQLRNISTGNNFPIYINFTFTSGFGLNSCIFPIKIQSAEQLGKLNRGIAETLIGEEKDGQ